MSGIVLRGFRGFYRAHVGACVLSLLFSFSYPVIICFDESIFWVIAHGFLYLILSEICWI